MTGFFAAKRWLYGSVMNHPSLPKFTVEVITYNMTFTSTPTCSGQLSGDLHRRQKYRGIHHCQTVATKKESHLKPL